jgi:hypothetical protein
MMVNDIFYELIGLRDRVTPLNRKIDKKMFFEQLEFSSKERQKFTQWIDRVVLTYILASQNINIHPFVDEEKRYENVSFISVSLKKRVTIKQVQHLSVLLHESLPNPTVLCFTHEESILICTGLKRINKNNVKNAIIEEIRLTNWLNLKDMEDITDQFIKKIHLSSLSFTTFYHLYSDLHYALQLFDVAKKTGQFISYEENELQKVTALVEQTSKLEAEIEHYRKMIKKESQFNKKVEYNLKVQTLKQQYETLKMKMKNRGGKK